MGNAEKLLNISKIKKLKCRLAAEEAPGDGSRGEKCKQKGE